MLQRSNPMPLVLAVADPEHEQPDWQEQHGELHVGDLGHEEDDAGQENQCEIVRPRVEDGVKFRLLMVQAAVRRNFRCVTQMTTQLMTAAHVAIIMRYMKTWPCRK